MYVLLKAQIEDEAILAPENVGQIEDNRQALRPNSKAVDVMVAQKFVLPLAPRRYPVDHPSFETCTTLVGTMILVVVVVLVVAWDTGISDLEPNFGVGSQDRRRS